jgi:transposase
MDCLVVMEATGTYYLRLAEHLYHNGVKVSVVNPLIIKRFSEMRLKRTKTDKADARIISQYGYSEKPKDFIPDSNIVKEIKLRAQIIQDLIVTRTQYKNRLHALENETIDTGVIAGHYLALIETISKEIKTLEKSITDLIKQEYSEEYEKVMKIPGVGERTAGAIFGYLKGFKNFENAKQVISYIGTNPVEHRSGTSVNGKSYISKKGSRYLRGVFYMSAVAAFQFNPACRTFYLRLRSEGKPFKFAVIAVLNKLIKIIFAIVKHKRDYDPEYYLKISQKNIAEA